MSLYVILINYSRKLSKVFIFPTSGIRAYGGKFIKVSFAIEVETRCVYLKPFRKWSRTGPFRSGSEDDILH